MEVAADQTTTLVGQFDSLKAVLEELCSRAGVELRAYDADDRAVSANYRDLPLGDVMTALLNHENYLLGQGRDPATGNARVAWVHVSGNQSGPVTKMAARKLGSEMGFDTPPPPAPAAAPAPPAPAAVPPPVAPLGENPDVSEELLASLAEKMFGGEKRQQFLITDAEVLAGSLQHYPDSPQLVRRLLGQQNDPAIIQKLTEVLSAMK